MRSISFFLLIVTLSFPAGFALFKFAEKHTQEALVKLDIVPLTRANSGDLPAPDTLVRASQEPVQTAQQAELLRAAQYGQETPAEELLRASTTQEHRQNV